MVSYPKISMIVAKARNNVIGRDGDLPWRLSSDLKFFKKTTLGKPVLMGRVTWESLPFPLPGRANLVLTRQTTYEGEGAEVFHSLREMVGRGFEIAAETSADEIMIIGGAGLYTAMMDYADRLYVTEVDADIDGDAVFPEIDRDVWARISQTNMQQNKKDDFPFAVSVFERRAIKD